MRVSAYDRVRNRHHCALPIENDAVESLFDHFWDEDGHGYGKARDDANAYTTGVIGNHNVVLAHMPGMGKGNAAIVATSFRFSFRNIKLALLVGICGGVPIGDTGQLFLGDVVVGDEIIPYDFGRRFPGNFVRKDALVDNHGVSSLEVRAFLNKLRGRRGRYNLSKRTAHHFAVLQQGTDSHNHPGIRQDRLFDPRYHHKHHNKACFECISGHICEVARSATCEELQCDRKRVIVRSRVARALEALGTKHSSPRIQFGRIASADSVMKSGEDRDNIARQENVLCFEMEGAGVFSSLPCLVIKGVSDYADSHKDKIWQGYAAGTAAACAKALLEQWEVTDRASLGTTAPVNGMIL
ncbi:hypothetical protein BDW74DRAFT_169268 [Aspergillus multicolor]|uniref:uncharacterized protein n=1 Tax=Aspergillus multicolor TaxID=41759 RepID=UPI003CCC96D7